MPLPIWIQLTQQQIDILYTSSPCQYSRKDKENDLLTITTQGTEPCSQILIGVKRDSLP
jgi:hypothetical protein